SPDKMLLGRLFSYPDTHRYRIGPNYMDLPVNQPKSPVHSYAKDGPMRYSIGSDPVYAPNTYGGPKADPRYADDVAAYGVTDEFVTGPPGRGRPPGSRAARGRCAAHLPPRTPPPGTVDLPRSRSRTRGSGRRAGAPPRTPRPRPAVGRTARPRRAADRTRRWP